MQCTKELEKWRNEWTRTLHITEYEPCYEEDYDVEQFLLHDIRLGDQEMVVTGWEKENSSSDCDGSEDDSCNQEVDNNSCIKEKKECKQVSDKSRVSEEKVESCQASSKRLKKRVCPLKGCKSQVIDLPRHLRDVHKWSREKAQKATSKFGMRKSFSSEVVEKEKNKWKDYHHHRKCPVQGYYSTVKRLSHHLQQVHKEIRKGSSEYKTLLKEARSIKPWRSSSRSNHADNSSKARIKVKGDDRKGSNTQGSESSSDVGSYEDISDSEWEGEAESTSSIETSNGIFGTFATWLQTADGGRKPEKMSKQHASQINKMLAVIDPSKDLGSLFDKKLIRDTFLKNHAENAYKPDTIKSYLLSLRYFCSFVLTESPDAVNVNEASVHLIDEKARLWSSSYKKESQRRHLEKQDEDLSNLITPEMVTEYEQRESTRKAVSLISQLSGAHCLQINQAEYTLIRDFILTQITIANAHRSGVLANMTMGEFKKAKLSQGSFVITVKKHKTADIHGPARVVLSPTLFGYLKMYVADVRSVVSQTKDDDDAVILSWSGARVASGQISTAINASWKKAGLQGHISSTLFRKSAVTTVHTKHKDMTGQLADLMAHKESTAQRYYKLHEKQQSSIQAAAELPSIMRATSTANKVSEEGTSMTKVGETNPASTEGAKENKIKWTAQQIAAIRELFQEEINQKSVTMQEVRDKIKDHPTLHDQDAKKVCDRVRSEWRGIENGNKPESDFAAELPGEEETLSDKMSRFLSSSAEFVPPSNSSYLSRNIFSLNNKETLFQLFGGMIRSGIISKPVVKDTLEKEEAGREILRKFTVEQIVNRKRYERRLNRRR